MEASLEKAVEKILREHGLLSRRSRRASKDVLSEMKEALDRAGQLEAQGEPTVVYCRKLA